MPAEPARSRTARSLHSWLAFPFGDDNNFKISVLPMGEAIYGSGNLWERKFMGVAIYGRGNLWEWKFMGVEIYGSGNLWEWQFMGVAIYGRGNLWERKVMGVEIYGSGNLWEWQFKSIDPNPQSKSLDPGTRTAAGRENLQFKSADPGPPDRCRPRKSTIQIKQSNKETN